MSLASVWLGDQLEGRHDLLLEVSPLGDREVEFCLWQVDEHTSDLWSFLLANDLLDVLVDGVANQFLLLSSVSVLEVRRGEHLLDLVEVMLGILEVNKLWSSGGGHGGATSGDL